MSGPTDPGAGSASYPITFTNRGSAPCTLSGFPGVSAVGSGGQQLGQPASRTSQAASTVIIQPGQAGTAVLRVAQAANFGSPSCGTPAQATGLRVYPPGQRAAAIASTSFSACTGSAVQLQINPVTS